MVKTKKTVRETQVASRGINERLKECNAAYTTGAFKYLRLLVHFIGAAQFFYAIYYWDVNVTLPHNDPKGTWGGKLKFLTFLDVILQAVYHSLAFLNDIIGSNAVDPQPAPFLRKLRDSIFRILAFPTALNVCLSFWVVYGYDRELIFPRALDPYFPNWLNHVVHTNIAMLMIMDLFTCFRQYPAGKSGVIKTSMVMFAYIIWLHVTHYHNGRWAYPLFDALNLPMRYFMLFGMIFVSVICYFVGEFLNNVVWSPELKLLQQKSKVKEN